MASSLKIGIITPTCNRPDMARFLALQMQNQSRRPDLVCFHQNGTQESYEWALSDLSLDYEYIWLHTDHIIPQDEWYLRPLEKLIKSECTHYFWCDHDDFYNREHISKSVEIIVNGDSDGSYDFIVNSRCGFLKLSKPPYHTANRIFKLHAPDGMSSSMCFNRKFAEELAIDIRNNKNENKYKFTDQVVGWITKKKFRSIAYSDQPPTTTFVVHGQNRSCSHWLDRTDVSIKPISSEKSVFTSLFKLTVHLGVVGDVECSETMSVSGRYEDNKCIQGFVLEIDTLFVNYIAYRARLFSGEWTNWLKSGEYAGTRGKQKNITGYSVKLLPPLANIVSLKLSGMFGKENTIVHSSNSNCTFDNTVMPLVGMQISMRCISQQDTSLNQNQGNHDEYFNAVIGLG